MAIVLALLAGGLIGLLIAWCVFAWWITKDGGIWR